MKTTRRFCPEHVRVQILVHSRSAKHPGHLPSLFAGCFLLLCGLLFGCGSASEPRADSAASATTVAVVKVTRHNLTDRLEIASEFLPYQEIDVYAKVSGYVQKLYVDWGTHVKKGQILADLEIPELQQQIQQDDANVH